MCMVGWKLPVQYFPSWDVHVLQLSFSQNCNMIKSAVILIVGTSLQSELLNWEIQILIIFFV